LAGSFLEPRIERRNVGLRVLLYAHEIVLDFWDFFAYLNPDDQKWRGGRDYAAVLRQLAAIRPLVETAR
jgi:hypothetical protein